MMEQFTLALRRIITERGTNASKVALATGVSASTVGRALRGQPIVSDSLWKLMEWAGCAYSSPSDEEPKDAQGDWRHDTPETRARFITTVFEDLQRRQQTAMERFGERFQGDPLDHAWEELLDALFYVRVAKRQRGQLLKDLNWQEAVNADLRAEKNGEATDERSAHA